jgi:Ca2+-binding EF-hand superfamily protein
MGREVFAIGFHFLLIRNDAGHSREQARKQIEASEKIRRDETIIRDIFNKYAVQSEEQDQYAHIPRAKLLTALQSLGIEVQKDEPEDFFCRQDHGDGFFDLDDFKQVILAPHKQPHPAKIREAFDKYAVKLQCDDPFLPEAHITPKKISNALRFLELGGRASEQVLAYFADSVPSHGVISFEDFNQAVLSTFPLPDEQEVLRVFQENAEPGAYTYLPMSELRNALSELGLTITGQQLEHFRRTARLNFNDCIKYNAFKAIVLTPSPMEVWAATLPLARLLAEALPKHSDYNHLRIISSLTSNESDAVAEEVCQALKEVLKGHVAHLKKAFMTMDEKVCFPLLFLPDLSPHSDSFLCSPSHQRVRTSFSYFICVHACIIRSVYSLTEEPYMRVQIANICRSQTTLLPLLFCKVLDPPFRSGASGRKIPLVVYASGLLCCV